MYFRDDNDKVLPKVKIRHLQAVKIVHFFIKIQIQKLYSSFFLLSKLHPTKTLKKVVIFLLYISYFILNISWTCGFFFNYLSLGYIVTTKYFTNKVPFLILCLLIQWGKKYISNFSSIIKVLNIALEKKQVVFCF